MDPKISVVIPFFRRQAVFEETLNSALNQTYNAFEIVVVDDCSGGDATEYLQQFSEHIKIVTLTVNGGVSNARNIGVENSAGDYIAFLDSDDIWLSEKLQKQVDFPPDSGAFEAEGVNRSPGSTTPWASAASTGAV
jgi:teichuronic acid biosynthesis glycosyltransferase TuaG